MKIIVKDEHNFFLFQDIVYYFLLTLERKWRFPIQSKHKNSPASYCIYESWKDVLHTKVFSKNSTKLSKILINVLTDWMVTTNIAILTAQKERKVRKLDSHEIEYIEKYKPYFQIEFSNNYNDYIVNLDGKIEELFLNAVSFYKSFLVLDYSTILNELKKYFEIEEELISNELDIVIKNYDVDEFVQNMLDSYEIMEDSKI